METIIIAAVAENNVIGKNNAIPWRLKEDFQHFKDLTMGYPCIMGRKTFESIPPKFRPLPGRENIVLTSDDRYKPEGATVFGSLEAALEYCRKKGSERVFIIGGASVYNLAMGLADVLEITRVHKAFEGDTLFPEIRIEDWEVQSTQDLEAMDLKGNEAVKLSFVRYKRRR